MTRVIHLKNTIVLAIGPPTVEGFKFRARNGLAALSGAGPSTPSSLSPYMWCSSSFSDCCSDAMDKLKAFVAKYG